MPLVYILALVGVVLLIFGSEVLVRGAKELSRRFGLSELVIGLTVVAFGTSSPELAVTMASGFQGSTSLAAGNVIGSNICNILLILGLAALARPLFINRRLLLVDVPALLLMTGLFAYYAVDGELVRSEGIYMLLGLIVYIGIAITLGYMKKKVSFTKEEEESDPPLSLRASLAYLIGGLFCLFLGSTWVVGGAVELARQLGVDEKTIGLTIVALGTSLPEVAVSVVGAIRGRTGMVIGNVIGSNLFNIGAVLGITLTCIPSSIPVEGSALTFDLPVMCLVTLSLLPMMVSRSKIGRFEGFMLFAWYILIMAYTVLTVKANHIAPILGDTMIWVVGPITVLVLLYFMFFRGAKKE